MVIVPDFELPDYWPPAYGLDVGWRKTAAIWGARDNESGVVYLYSEHYAGQKEPSLHAESIKARGEWIPGVIDPAAQGRSQVDGQELIQIYPRQGLMLSPAVNAVEAGLYAVWQMMSAGKLKVFASLGNYRQEFRLYARDIDGKVIKVNDHLMDAKRYLVMSGLARMQTKPTTQMQIDPRGEISGNPDVRPLDDVKVLLNWRQTVIGHISIPSGRSPRRVVSRWLSSIHQLWLRLLVWRARRRKRLNHSEGPSSLLGPNFQTLYRDVLTRVAATEKHAGTQ
jgi:Terminase RNaseH-like domain